MEIQLLIWVQKDLRILAENEAMKLYIENPLWTFCVSDKGFVSNIE